MNCQYCLWCGSALNFVSKDKYVCTGCAKVHYVCPKTSAGAFVMSGKNEDKRIYLSVRGKEPRIGKLDVFGGFLDTDETMEDAVIREFEEETGLKRSAINTLVYVGSNTELYEWQGDKYPVSSAYFATMIESPESMIPSDDIVEIKSFKKNDLKQEDFAWPGVYHLAVKAWDVL